MTLRNGMRAIGLGISAWMLYLGAAQAQEPAADINGFYSAPVDGSIDGAPADEPPLELFLDREGVQAFENAFGANSCEANWETCDSGCPASAEPVAAPRYRTRFFVSGKKYRVVPVPTPCRGWQDFGLTFVSGWGVDNLTSLWHSLNAPYCDADAAPAAAYPGTTWNAAFPGAPTFPMWESACEWSTCDNCCNDVFCDACQSPFDCECVACEDGVAFCEGFIENEFTTLEPGEPAEVLLDIRRRVGMTPLTGTAYQPIDSSTCAKAQNTFVAEVRESAESCEANCVDPELEALFEDESAPAEPAPAEQYPRTTEYGAWQPALPSRPYPVAPASGERARAELIPVLRLVSRNLEEAANTLEDAELYFRADQLRQLSTELRLEARSAGGEWSLEPLGSVTRKPTAAIMPAPDLARENDELRMELERLKEMLRAYHAPQGIRSR